MKTQTIGVRVQNDFKADLDKFRRSEPDLPSRAEAFRALRGRRCWDVRHVK